MSARNDLLPDELFRTLLEQARREERRRNLKLVHQICKAQAASSRDFSVKAIGALSEVAGGLSARALYNASSSTYRDLIDAWARHVGSPCKKGKGSKPERLDEQLLRLVTDPALRSLVQQAFNERNRLRGELNLLKSVTCFNIDRRPRTTRLEPAAATQVGLLLTVSEREALEQAVSPEFLADEGWTETEDGRIQNERGRTVFRVGFARAIRKVLASAP